ncbi:MAG: hypothetical protein A3J46_04485 [Candidatus Yanofskybacteria bacterium RIFCSPHIGHO2_02_FULL_41_11]|uniref:Addiction module antitoxin RelB n=1 Tax=Candidatus Yanofskybacteria bacterium RIFCSPHIGHO2_02_FULL_41_11 TaxID=1802675 RepID=A0A1F8FCI4_9BACT|nr:MAG: hypothetical protein A3J46_04485 [Candidatus Yanofskybacteria bacterium RIFCSPHIGHO2_02_FULL_41_11]
MFKVVYHYLVVREDIPRLPKVWKEKIRVIVGERLVASPDLYGKPLRRSLKGYYKLRAGDYRVIFKIEKKKVKVLLIEHRSVIYTKIQKRK